MCCTCWAMARILQYSASAEAECDGAATFTSHASPVKLSEPLWKQASRFCQERFQGHPKHHQTPTTTTKVCIPGFWLFHVCILRFWAVPCVCFRIWAALGVCQVSGCFRSASEVSFRFCAVLGVFFRFWAPLGVGFRFWTDSGV